MRKTVVSKKIGEEQINRKKESDMDSIHAHTFHVTHVCELIIEGSATRWNKDSLE
jgi:hypothetical protein